MDGLCLLTSKHTLKINAANEVWKMLHIRFGSKYSFKLKIKVLKVESEVEVESEGAKSDGRPTPVAPDSPLIIIDHP